MSRYIDAERIDLRLIRPTYITTGEECMLLNIRNLIDRQPTADVQEVVHGEWIPRQDLIQGEIYDGHRCSNCGAWKSVLEKYNYCPNCGAKMDLKEVKK